MDSALKLDQKVRVTGINGNYPRDGIITKIARIIVTVTLENGKELRFYMATGKCADPGYRNMSFQTHEAIAAAQASRRERALTALAAAGLAPAPGATVHVQVLEAAAEAVKRFADRPPLEEEG